MIYTGVKDDKGPPQYLNYESPPKVKTDGVPSIDKSLSAKYNNRDQLSTSKYLLNDIEEDERLSNIANIFDEKDPKQFILLYNK